MSLKMFEPKESTWQRYEKQNLLFLLLLSPPSCKEERGDVYYKLSHKKI